MKVALLGRLCCDELLRRDEGGFVAMKVASSRRRYCSIQQLLLFVKFSISLLGFHSKSARHNQIWDYSIL